MVVSADPEVVHQSLAMLAMAATAGRRVAVGAVAELLSTVSETPALVVLVEMEGSK
jgi:hypothetical protein